MTGIADRLRAARVVPVIRTSTEAAARRAIEILSDEGFDLFELTMTTPGALNVLSAFAGRSDLWLGMGTVLTVEQGRAALDAGAGFIVSPAFIDGLSEACREVPVALGAATPTEALRAHEAGARFVKIFPAAQLGGPGFVSALQSVYPQMSLMPTGGIEVADIPAYLAAGAVCVGMGGKLVSDAALRKGNEDLLREAARVVRAVLA